MKPTQTRVVFCWHMHQPCYQDQLNRQYLLPWVYLHAIKDYTDMANILESIPQARAVINFCPILLEQIDEYDRQLKAFLQGDKPLADPLLGMLSARVLPSSAEQRRDIIDRCLRANEHRMIKPHEPYFSLAELATRVQHRDMPLSYLEDQYFFDLLTWYHLAWLGETVRRTDSRITALIDKKSDYSYADRMLLLQIVGELIASVIPKYRHLAEIGQVELSVTPYSHPMLPLLLDMDCARESLPEAQLPSCRYPGGEARVAWQLDKAIEVFENYFGRRPAGCWPSEGGVSGPLLDMAAHAGFKWLASGESVLHGSLSKSLESRPQSGHQAFRVGDCPVSCFFRDDRLSDLIGFTYGDWHGDDAANNFLERLKDIHAGDRDEGRDRVVSIILDGENCWEYYSHNGFYFLTALYQSLVKHSDIRMTTFSECLADQVTFAPLPALVAGSWVYGNFSTWIGSPDKNLAWELLCEAKTAVDRVVAGGRLDDKLLARIERQLAVCEGSDWFWWFGDYNPGASVSEFDTLYRLHLRALYSLLGIDAPQRLETAISVGARTDAGPVEAGGVMRRGQPS